MDGIFWTGLLEVVAEKLGGRCCVVDESVDAAVDAYAYDGDGAGDASVLDGFVRTAWAIWVAVIWVCPNMHPIV
ncbi:hypothetical protein ACLOJK_006495 [Asimina triloba]